MANITIDGVKYEVQDGRTILQALDDLGLLMNGVDVPHYCWHPKLSIDGSCRLCQVEVEGLPKLQIACNTPVKDGMAISTSSERVKRARESNAVRHRAVCFEAKRAAKKSRRGAGPRLKRKGSDVGSTRTRWAARSCLRGPGRPGPAPGLART